MTRQTQATTGGKTAVSGGDWWTPLWTQQIHGLNAAAQQVLQQQQALLATWQEIQSAFATQWRRQAEQMLRAWRSSADGGGAR